MEAVELHGQSLRQWYERLTNEGASDVVPCSRYGRTGADVAWWALACEAIYVHANGEDDDPQVALDYLMSLAVNDSDNVLELVRSCWYAVPEVLKPYLDYEDDGLNMAQQSKLVSLCERFGVENDRSHYLLHPPGSVMMPGWAEGWLGGAPGTLYVGVSPEGDSHS
jgi:hypothetical protein